MANGTSVRAEKQIHATDFIHLQYKYHRACFCNQNNFNFITVIL